MSANRRSPQSLAAAAGRRPSPALPSALYAIVDPDADPHRPVLDLTTAILNAGGRLIQLRMKNRSGSDILAAATALRERTAAAGAALIINDRVDIALAVRADGVHLGADDLPVPEARRIAGTGLLIGRSTHGLDEAMAAVAAGADYIGFGPIYATATKAVGHPPQGLEILREIRVQVHIPIVAIGGITETTAPAVHAAGADAIAMIGELARATDLEAKVRRLLAALVPPGGGSQR